MRFYFWLLGKLRLRAASTHKRQRDAEAHITNPLSSSDLPTTIALFLRHQHRFKSVFYRDGRPAVEARA